VKNRVAPEMEAGVMPFATEQPGWACSERALHQGGMSIWPFGVRGVWQRHDFGNMKARLKALDAKVAQEGRLLTESQLAALEKAKVEKEAHGWV
jgi:hypothetical protein